MKTISRRKFLQVSAVASAGAVLAACGGTQPPATPATDETVAAPATPAPAAQASPTPVAEKVWPRQNVARNRTLNLMNGVGGVGIAGPYAAGFTHQCGDAAQMEAMFYYTALNDKTYAWLAESFEYNADATECTVYIRRGIKWNDGEPFTAKDVAFTYMYLKEHAPLLRDSGLVDRRIETAEAIDDFTVKFTLKEPDFRFHFTYCTFRFDRGIYLIPEHIYKDVDNPAEFLFFEVGSSPEEGWPVHTGPYKLVRTEETVRVLDLLYDWWAYDVGLVDRMPWVERIIDIIFPGDEVAGQMIINNEVDVSLDLRPATIESILNQASDRVISHTGLQKPYGYVDWWPISMYPNNFTEPYDDVRVRWALAYAIDQQTLVDVGWDGAGSVAFTPFPDYPGITKYYAGAQAIFDQYNVLERNLDKVEELMTDAGFEKDAQGFWVRDGQRPPADIYAGVPLFGDIAPITAELLRQAGFDANHVTPPDVWDAKSDGRAPLHFFGHGGSVDDPYITLQMYHSVHQRPTGENCGDNRPRWANAEYDAIVEEMSRTPSDDEAKMQDLFNKAMEIWYRELPEVPLVQWYHRLAMNVTYWTNWPNQDNPYNSAYWHLTFPITLWNLEPVQ